MITIGELADGIPGAEVIGDKNHAVNRVVHPAALQSEHDLFFLASEQLAERIHATGAPKACAIIDREIWQRKGSELSQRLVAAIVSPRPRYALARASACFPRVPRKAPSIHASACIDPDAVIADGCVIGPGVVIGENVSVGAETVIEANVCIGEGALIGAHCRLRAGVVIADGVVLGSRVIIQPNAVIGGDGFAFDTEQRNLAEQAKHGEVSTDRLTQRWERIESFGTVFVGDDVEIGAGTTIDRATFGETRIGRGCKIDNLVQIGHNCRVGEDTLLCAQVGLAGSTEIGKGCILAGKVGVADHVSIGDFAVIMAKSGVTRHLEGGAVYYGMPARPVKETLRAYSHISKLGDMRQRLAALERVVRRQGD